SSPSPVRPNDLRPRHQRACSWLANVHAAVSHGLTSSPLKGEGDLRRWSGVARNVHREEHEVTKAKETRDRVALVTGAASGIGLATVERLLEAGWKVAALDRDEGALASVAGKIGKPQRVFTSTLDVTNEVAAEKAVAMVGEALGRIDG